MAKPCAACSIGALGGSLIGVTAGWFAVYTLSCREKQVARHLEMHSIEHFLPVTKSRRRWKNGCTVLVEEPLFPGYLFVQIDRSDRTHVLGVPGVHSIVGTGKDPIALPHFEIETLRRSVDHLRIEPHPYLNVGEKATILRGPLAGMTGIVVRKKNGLRFILSLDLIMKSVAVEVDAADLEPSGDVHWSTHDKPSSSVPYVVC
jgi:transcription antitermination factor NusG